MRFAPVLLGLGLALGGYLALSALDPGGAPARTAHLAERAETRIALYSEALRRDPGSPYRWADLADALFLAGNSTIPRHLYEGAARRAPHVPHIAVRAANFHFLDNRPADGLREAARALRIADAFDASLFRSFDQMIGDPAAVLKEIGTDRRSSYAYTRHLIATQQIDAAGIAWSWSRDRGFADDRLAASYIDLLLRDKQSRQAAAAWVSYLGDRRGDYPSPNLVYNGSFEREPTGAALDWRIAPSGRFETSLDSSVARDGKTSLRIQFQGGENVSYSHLAQSVVAAPGQYRFQVWVKTDSITTNEGPQFQIYDPANPTRLDVRIGPFLGSSDWQKVEQAISVAGGTDLIVLRVLRQPSRKFDSKVSGTVWVDAVSLVRQ